MTRTIDLNADMGESFGPWPMGSDAALLKIVSSANIACGFHAGDPDTMARTMTLAARSGVSLGAHPGFADLQGFGRRRIPLSGDELTHMIQYQLGAAQALAAARGARIKHFKLHGALSNMACEDLEMATTCFRAALAVQPDLRLLALPCTALEQAAVDLGAKVSREIFADRTYAETGLLTDRGQPDAMVHDPEEAATRILAMLRDGGIRTTGGTLLPTPIDTICVHGDGAEALAIATRLAQALTDAGYRIAAPTD
ncbi:5-oxoprolinase subunit PxpA [Salipiger sp. IMCC34102]|uniref:LamB/YcsF family protein n=1 Tax=Salipiger sp. IMCC34102 TaxID=2510647 RepID=UPI00101DA081|nr:5-oxoprolinase subunit PxpA [Salipiger sp. IMCC34102]RYH03526.1 5-oxoprolinase subunit PxpA [Salipiger sp. IMCC34102]